jgi:hypothetical protein
MAHPGGWKIRIPDGDKQNITNLFALSEQDTAKLAAALVQAKPMVSLREFTEQVRVEGVEQTVVEGVIEVLISLLVAAEVRQRSADELASEVVSAAIAQNISTKADSEARLTQLMTADSALCITAKAIALSNEHERIFSSARVLTDMRPIFSGTPPQPKAAVITHTLRIESHKAEGHTSEFFGLDLNDLRTLRDALDRAISKEESIRASVRSEGLSIIGSKFLRRACSLVRTRSSARVGV